MNTFTTQNKETLLMAKVEVYTTDYCPYCVRAKALLSKKGVAFQEIDVTHDDAARAALVKKSDGRKTVPQIFINDQSIGGCDDLYALDRDGKLDGMLAA
jgi:glutaredoxin 3